MGTWSFPQGSGDASRAREAGLQCSGQEPGWCWSPHHACLCSAPQVPAPLPGGGQGAAPFARHGQWTPRVGRPDGAALAPCPPHGAGWEGSSHQHRSVPSAASPLLLQQVLSPLPIPLCSLCASLLQPCVCHPAADAFGPTKQLGSAQGPGMFTTSASGHLIHPWGSAYSSRVFSRASPALLLPGSVCSWTVWGIQADGLGAAGGREKGQQVMRCSLPAPKGDSLWHGGAHFASW